MSGLKYKNSSGELLRQASRAPTKFIPAWFLFSCLSVAIFSGAQSAWGAAPRIISISPTWGPPGTPVTITGTGFGALAISNAVYFGTEKCSDVSVLPTGNLLVKSPTGATYGPVTVTVVGFGLTPGLTAYSATNFLPSFNGNPDVNPGSFTDYVNVATAPDPSLLGFAVGDIDGDGNPDLCVVKKMAGGLRSLLVFRNKGTGGTVSSNSFESPVSIPLVLPSGKAAVDARKVVLADLDGDGRLDFIICDPSDNSAWIVQNKSNNGNISFGPVAQVLNVGGSAMVARDMNGDGQPDLIGVESNVLTVALNTTADQFGSINFDTNNYVLPITISVPGDGVDVAVGDLDGDGIPDIAVADEAGGKIWLYRNSCPPGGTFTTNSLTLQQPSLEAGPMTNGISASLPVAMAIGDLNLGGLPDLVIGNRPNPNLAHLFPFNPVAFFTNQSGLGPAGIIQFGQRIDLPAPGTEAGGVAIGDANGDGWPDIVATFSGANGAITQGVAVFKNKILQKAAPIGFDSFEPVNFKDVPQGMVAMADVNGDGAPELFAGTSFDGVPGTTAISVLQNQMAQSCHYAPIPGSATIDGCTTNGSVFVDTSPECGWTASTGPNSSWISLSNSTGIGTNYINFSLGTNPSSNPRTGTINISGQTFTLTQLGLDCTVSLSTNMLTIACGGGPVTVNVTTASCCNWAAVSETNWLIVQPGSSAGQGNGSFQFEVVMNASGARTGKIIVGGATLTVMQESCSSPPPTITLSPILMKVPAEGWQGVFSVKTAPGNPWSAHKSCTWVHLKPHDAIYDSVSGIGNGIVSYTVDEDTTTNSVPVGTPPPNFRSELIVVGDKTFTIQQTQHTKQIARLPE